MLLESLPADTIRWGSKATDLRRLAGQEGAYGPAFEIEFASGDVVTTDLLIGADGAWSRTRPLLSDARPTDTGISFVEFDLQHADTHHAAEAAMLGTGMMFALQGNTGMLGHRETDGSLHIYLGLRAEQGWIDTIDWTDTALARTTVLELLAGWHDDLRGMVAHADSFFTPRTINALPVGHLWPRVPGVTLLGDAAHVMSPFAGEGANLAMYDGARLAQLIGAHPGDTEAALAAYEAEMFPRTEQAATESASNLDVIFNDDAPASVVRMFEGFDAQRPSDAMPYRAE